MVLNIPFTFEREDGQLFLSILFDCREIGELVRGIEKFAISSRSRENKSYISKKKKKKVDKFRYRSPRRIFDGYLENTEEERHPVGFLCNYADRHRRSFGRSIWI